MIVCVYFARVWHCASDFREVVKPPSTQPLIPSTIYAAGVKNKISKDIHAAKSSYNKHECTAARGLATIQINLISYAGEVQFSFCMSSTYANVHCYIYI